MTSTAAQAPAATDLVRRLWQYCNVLRDDGLSYPDYVEQLTYLLFLKMADEEPAGPVPPDLGWSTFAHLDAPAMYVQYGRVLAALGRHTGLLGMIFREARNKVRDPAKLRLLVAGLIGQVSWRDMSADVKGDAYEGLLEKNARDTKSGAGQYFTPRALVDAIVTCVDPTPGDVVSDPACGTGGFLLAAHQHVRTRRVAPGDDREGRMLKVRGIELVPEVARLAAMNALLHGISVPESGTEDLPIQCADSLRAPPHAFADVVLTNPPFGIRGSVLYAGADDVPPGDELTVVRPDFWVLTANKQLNFLQHIYRLLAPGGRAAVVVPDNVLFESGAAALVRRRLVEDFDVHTLLRLPSGLFYASGVKANVLFFDRPPAGATPSAARSLWVYDLRTGKHFSLKKRPLAASDLADFVACYRPGARDARARGVAGADGSLRWGAVEVAAILEDPSCRLDLLADGRAGDAVPVASSRARLDQLAAEIHANLLFALDQIALAAGGTDAVPNRRPGQQPRGARGTKARRPRAGGAGRGDALPL